MHQLNHSHREHVACTVNDDLPIRYRSSELLCTINIFSVSAIYIFCIYYIKIAHYFIMIDILSEK